ncbi:hypothetical protein L7F22_059052 [Adiantum nelumboides]|nr:hypothetical protein [Adiantum nelumboides]
MDGQSEIANLTVLDLLKAYVTEVDQRSQWEKYLPLVEYAYNNTVHTSTGKAPFEVIEGRSKSSLLLKVHGKIFAVDEYSRDLKESFQKIKEAISIAQQKQKAAANKHRRALAFKENDWVLLKFPKARLRHTMGKNPTGHQKYYAKLAKRYYGPFQILKPINEMAYQLKLPNHWLIHNAFHVSLLKPYKGEPPKEAIMEDPPEVEGQEEVLQPESVLRHEDKVLRNDAYGYDNAYGYKAYDCDGAYGYDDAYDCNDNAYGFINVYSCADLSLFDVCLGVCHIGVLFRHISDDIRTFMATVDQGINLQSSAVSTLNFLPAVPSSWAPAASPPPPPPQHHHHQQQQHDSNFAVMTWEPDCTSNPGHEEATPAAEGSANCMNLMERMAYTQPNLMNSGFERTHGVDWAAAKFDDEDRENEKLGDQLNIRMKDNKVKEQYNDNYISPNVSINMSSHSTSSEVVQLGVDVNEEAPTSSAADHHMYPHHGLLLASRSSLLQQKRHRDSAAPSLNISSVAPHEPFDSPLHKKQCATPATKDTMNKEDQSSLEVGPALNTNGRPRAKRGSATDPQSVYARQRRERINERLKILQNLVPNGAKVDIVTMLEEAISYVKFLQLQVKLLSSDEYWMYAPTTYNGIDVSFDMLQHST